MREINDPGLTNVSPYQFLGPIFEEVGVSDPPEFGPAEALSRPDAAQPLGVA
jgi:hypothetical protein